VILAYSQARVFGYDIWYSSKCILLCDAILFSLLLRTSDHAIPATCSNYGYTLFKEQARSKASNVSQFSSLALPLLYRVVVLTLTLNPGGWAKKRWKRSKEIDGVTRYGEAGPPKILDLFSTLESM
jgi:hypothetical protein